MTNVLIISGFYLFAMMLGYILKLAGIFRKEDKKVISNLIFYVTLPAMLISSFSDVDVNIYYLVALGLGLLINGIMVVLGQLACRNKSPELKAIYSVNSSGFNLGNVTIPFLKNVYPSGIPYLCMFDMGDSCFTLGTTYAIANMHLGRKSGNPIKEIMKSLVKSVPFDTYVTMTVLSLIHFKLPDIIMQTADFCGKGNGFLAMIMVGISLEFKMEKSAVKEVLRILGMRYIISAVAAVIIFCFIPAPLIMRQILAAAVFTAVPTVALIYNERLGISTDIAAALNPVTTILMIPLMVITIAITQGI
ncbi:MAG: AEC family transporter [Lachnospira sp.]